MIDTDKYEGHIASEGRTWIWSKWMLKNAETRRLKEHKATRHLLNDAPLLLEEVKRLHDIINKAMQQHGVLEMRGCLFESGCIDAEGQYESGHWEREGEEK